MATRQPKILTQRLTAAISLALLFAFPLIVCAQAAKPETDDTGPVKHARDLFESKQYAEALGAYRDLVQTSTDQTFIYAAGGEAHVRIGECLYHLRRYKEAAAALREALAKYPTGAGRFRPELMLGDCLVKTKEYDKARQLYRWVREGYMKDLDIEQRIKTVESAHEPAVDNVTNRTDAAREKPPP